MDNIKVDKKQIRRPIFITIFPPIENIHLIKDVGMYPYSMYRYEGYKSGILVEKGQAYPYLEKELKGLCKYVMPSIFPSNEYNSILWLIRNAKNITVLNLFHQIRHTRISIALYKRINRSGKIYVHMDCSGVSYNDYQLGLDGNTLKRKIKRFIYKYVFYPEWIQKDIYWGVQNKEAVQSIKGKFPYKNVKYMPNGFYEKNHSIINFDEKENIVLTVGRIGTKEKRTDLLLEGFCKAVANISEDWKLRIVGPIEKKFENEIDEFYQKNPNLIERVEFVGAIYDRNELINQYKNAKIFCLTSDCESFGIVLVEALSQGCSILTTNFPAAYDITKNGTCGQIFKCGSVNDFSDKLIKMIENPEYLSACCTRGEKVAMEEFNYKSISKKLNEWMGSI